MSKRVFLTLVLTFSLLITVIPAALASGPAQEGSLQIKGSDTMVNLNTAWAEAYMAAHPGASIAVTGGGSGTGIAALINGTTDIAAASRKMKDEEIAEAQARGIEPVEHIVGMDAVAVIVNANNPVEELSLTQLADIYAGNIYNWAEVGGNDEEIVLLGRDTNSGTHEFFKEMVLHSVLGKGTEYSSDMLYMESSQAGYEEVRHNEAAIMYLGLGYVKEGVKAIRVNGVAPSYQTAMAGEYPLARPLHFYTNGQPAPDSLLAGFINFVKGCRGQVIVMTLGFVPYCE